MVGVLQEQESLIHAHPTPGQIRGWGEMSMRVEKYLIGQDKDPIELKLLQVGSKEGDGYADLTL